MVFLVPQSKMVPKKLVPDWYHVAKIGTMVPKHVAKIGTMVPKCVAKNGT